MLRRRAPAAVIAIGDARRRRAERALLEVVDVLASYQQGALSVEETLFTAHRLLSRAVVDALTGPAT